MEMQETLARKLMAMKRCLDFLRTKKGTTVRDLEDDYELRSAIERNFQVGIEAALDIAEVIISAEGLEKPEDYRGAILTLGRHGILPREFAERFAPAASFRNVLVHGYAQVDLQRLHGYLVDELEDLDEFAKCIVDYMETRKAS